MASAGVERDRTAEVEDRRRRIAPGDMAQPGFEEQLAEPGMVLRKTGQRFERGIDLLHHAQRMRFDKEEFAIGRIGHQQAFGAGCSACMIAFAPGGRRAP